MTKRFRPTGRGKWQLLTVAVAVMVLVGCTSRQVQDSLVGSTAQRLVTYSIDDLVRELPAKDFSSYAGQRMYIDSQFVQHPEIRTYADQRLSLELAHRFDIQVVPDRMMADVVLNVFYTSLGTDQNHLGLFIPLGFVPGLEQSTRVNLITLEQFHGIAEMYYYIGPKGTEQRGDIIQARTRTDALGLPIITIPISTIDRR